MIEPAAPQRSPATTERRPAPAEAGRSEAGRPERMHVAPAHEATFPPIHPAATSSTTPGPSHSGARATRTRDNPERSTSSTGNQSTEEQGAQPPEAGRHTRGGATDYGTERRPGRRPTRAAREDRARRPSMPSNPSRGQPEPRTPTRSAPEATRSHRSHASSPARPDAHRAQRNPQSAPQQTGSSPAEAGTEAARTGKRRGPAAHKDDEPPARKE